MSGDENRIPRRKVLATTGGLGGTLASIPGGVAGETSEDDRLKDDVQPLKSDYWTNEDGVVVLENAEFDEWEVLVTDQVSKPGGEIRPSQIPDRVDIYVGKYKNAELETGEAVRHYDEVRRPAPPGYRPDTYYTLADGTFPEFSTPVGDYGGWYWALQAGINWNITALEANIDITMQVGATSVTLWGVSLSHGEKDGLCTELSPGSAPVSVEPCIDVVLGDGSLSIGGSLDICVPQDDPCPYISCQKCLTGIGISRSFSTPW